MAITTSKAIRDRIAAVVGALTPTVHAELPFVPYRDEAGADFRRWANAHPQVCTRRVQARAVSGEQPPDVANTDVSAQLATFDVIVAYARRWRAGASFDRDDTMEADRILIERAIGRDGYGNFALSNPNASWLGPDARGSQTGTTFERDDGDVDFLVIRQTMRFYRSTSAPMTGVARDATSLKYVPASANQWASTIAAAGVESKIPSFLWLAQEAAADLADSIDSATLTAAGTPGYQQTVSGWSRKACTWADGASTRFANLAQVPDPNTNSVAMLGYVFTTNVPAATRQVFQIGSSTAVEARVTTGGKYRMHNQGNGTGSDFTAAYDSAVHPLWLVYNRAASTVKLYSDTEFASATYGIISGAFVGYGFSDLQAPTGGFLYGACWQGAAAEFSDAEVRAVLQTLGWTVNW